MDQKKKTGRGSVHWKFLEDMLQATKDRSSVMPGADLLVSSSAAAPQSPNSSAVPVTLSTLSTVTLADAKVQTPKKKKRLPQRGGGRNWLACFITYMDNHQKESEGRWQEARELKAEKFSIFKELLKVMKKKQLLVYSKFLEMFLKFLMQHCKNSVDW